MLKDMTKAVMSIVAIPVAVVADVITLGGAMTDKDKPYTAQTCSDLMKNISNTTKPRKGANDG